MYQKLYIYLLKPEKSGKRIGLFRILCSIFGGLLLSYCAMVFFSIIIPFPLKHSMIVPLYFIGLSWAISAFWISLSYTKLIALQRIFFPVLFFSFVITIYWNI